MTYSCFKVEKGSGYDALCAWLSQSSPDTSYLSIPPYLGGGKHDPPPSSPGCIGVYSSGSTGKPKLIWKHLSTLKQDCSDHPSNRARCWATCFCPSSFAGVQVALQAVTSGGKVIAFNGNWHTNTKRIMASKPEMLVLTPSCLDLLMQSLQIDRSQAWQPQQITLGGEPMRPSIAERLHAHFPKSRISLIYASAELGVIAKTHRTDGWYAFESLSKRFEDWRRQEGELQLLNKNTWIKTGDHCEIKGDHFRIIGRMDRVINVGGVKVCLDEIESIAESFPEVAGALAFAKENPLVGHVVALMLEPAGTTKNQAMLDEILDSMHGRLPKAAWPRWSAWGKVLEIKNGKRRLYPTSHVK